MSFDSTTDIISSSDMEDATEDSEAEASLIIDESIIDESVATDEESVTAKTNLSESSPVEERDKARHSEVFRFRKKHIRCLSSDSESDKENKEVNIPNQSDASPKLTDESSRSESDSKQSKLKDSSFEEDDIEDASEPGSKLEVSSFANEAIEEATEHVTNHTTSDNLEVSREYLPSKKTDVTHASTRFSKRTSQVSQDFQFNSEGILNSTALHPNLHERRENGNISIELLSDQSDNIVEVSSGEESYGPAMSPTKNQKSKPSFRQQTLFDVIGTHSNEKNSSSVKINLVTKLQYERQQAKVEKAELDLIKMQSMADGLDFEALPDKGAMIQQRIGDLNVKLATETAKFKNMTVSAELEDQNDQGAEARPNVSWHELQEGANAVLPKTFGKTAMSTYNAQKALTMDRLQQLHGALQTCPKEDQMEEDPQGLLVPLMPHQRRALAWLLFREKAKPSGGILADDMGLGKTLSIISLILRSAELESDSEDEDRNEFTSRNTKRDGGSLIVCPASLINQWSSEIDKRLKRGLLSYYLFHGAKRENSAKKLAKYDVVITTYSIVSVENNAGGVLNRIRWRRVILDEAHQIRNPKTSTSLACCQLLAKSRWALTGTPMHNKELDMYALLRFLRCVPFDDIQVWKRWVGDKSTGGEERLHTVISSLMLRRTKAELMEKGSLDMMPEKKWILVKVELDKSELNVYHRVLIFSQTLFAQFLHQRAEKNQDYLDHKFTGLPDNVANQEYYKMRQKLLKMNKVKNISQHEILVLLLRLRQICCHPSLITAMLDEELEEVDRHGDDDTNDQINLLEQLEKLNLEDEHPNDDDVYNPNRDLTAINNGEVVSVKDAARGHLKSSDPVFQKERASSKIKHMIKVLEEAVLSKEDKAIIVSQWSSYLALVGIHLKKYGVNFSQLDGKVPVHKRMEMVSSFNDPKNPVKVLLLSLTAGGVGLNLVGANHLFLLDLHWNPQLESQAQDRIYRMGQTKPVYIYKFMAVDTIEERIKMLQEKKLGMAEAILTGTRQVVENKLSLQDLKMIFGFGGVPNSE